MTHKFMTDKEEIVVIPKWLSSILRYIKICRYPSSKRQVVVNYHKVYHDGHGRLWTRHELQCQDDLCKCEYHTTHRFPTNTKCMLVVQPIEN